MTKKEEMETDLPEKTAAAKFATEKGFLILNFGKKSQHTKTHRIEKVALCNRASLTRRLTSSSIYPFKTYFQRHNWSDVVMIS